tara:strand:+ start:595 stop:1173 length:579 start_codon:yes stop_codon:yes gene_type:complete
MPLVIKGSSSGQVTVDVPAAAGTNTLTFPAATGDIITNKTAGTIIQVVNTVSSAVATGTTTFTYSNTIPNNSQGDEYMTLAITPTNSSNKLFIQIVALIASTNTNSAMNGALYQDSTSNALAATVSAKNDAVNAPSILTLNHFMDAGTTSETTFKFRGGNAGSATTTFNGLGGNVAFGAIPKSSITITEIAV